DLGYGGDGLGYGLGSGCSGQIWLTRVECLMEVICWCWWVFGDMVVVVVVGVRWWFTCAFGRNTITKFRCETRLLFQLLAVSASYWRWISSDWQTVEARKGIVPCHVSTHVHTISSSWVFYSALNLEKANYKELQTWGGSCSREFRLRILVCPTA
ncbi:hypothetical protein M8C21_014961, partial [Ambrosia artemisiifolia]